ncbi:Ti-type conjugative transfer relaxase TraA [Sphingomonas abietis]|uniref:Ti-type conjugative transfer relaxase TraA n=1 Tax=Sphingomonas abietis TaxID=3012344 RepID=A0ABY7NSM8_9SPHN|nr:Ti-type conjugative transfer relaxase TraA [Sphingomonas abietis]WBO24518.1 Ti-type conjugative transfer relaxase TraA [Sphingomonas abietis]
MAIYHFSAKMISRANGSSALAAAAYRSAARLHDQRLDRHHDFSNKAGVVHSEVMLPDGVPAELADREKLWNAIEAVEVRKDAQLAREIEFAIPRELDQAEGIRLAREFAQAEFVDKGMIADLNVHWDIGADGLAKPHAHVMLTTRSVDEDGFGPKVRDWNATALLEQWRERWAGHVNARLAELDIDARVDHRSLEAQGIDLEPQHKIGPAASRMAGQGLESERLAEHVEIARSNGEKIIANPGIALDAITRQQATFTTRDLAMFVHRHSEGKEQYDRLIAAVRASPDLVGLGNDGRGEERFTSRDMIETEQRLERATTAMAERSRHGVGELERSAALARAAQRGMILSAEQRDAFEHVTEAKGLGVVIGYAGTGKSAMLGVARDAWETAGYRVTGLALSGIAAENLESGSGIASRTVASMEHQWGQGRELLTRQDVLVVDEAGMIGSRQMERIVREAEKRGAKLVLVGDPEQLQAIEAGAAFRSVAERHGGVEIMEVRRQREDWQRDATRHLATGRTAQAIQAYDEAGHVHAAETREAARAALIDRWDAARKAEPEQSRMILTHTRDEVAELNTLARDRLRQGHELGIEYRHATERGDRLFASGDRIMFLANERSLGVKNGSLGTIESVSPTRMAVLMDDGRSVAFDVKDYADIDHGYAATIHKSQGVTVDRTHVLATPGLDRHATYVALSRHRDSVELHYGRDDFANEQRLVRTLSRERAKDMVSDHQMPAPTPDQPCNPVAGIKPRDRTPVPTPETSAPRHPFAGLQIRPEMLDPKPERARPRGIFDGIRIDPRIVEDRSPLDRAVERYAQARQESVRHMARGSVEPEPQKKVRMAAARLLKEIQPDAARDLEAALAAQPALAAEAAAGRTAAALRAMQAETELRTNPELRADRFVQTWQQLRARREKLGGWQHAEERDATDRRLSGMAKAVEKDPAMGSALVKRAGQLGLGRQWSPEWSAHSIDGGMGRELSEQIRARTVGVALAGMLGRERGIGL